MKNDPLSPVYVPQTTQKMSDKVKRHLPLQWNYQQKRWMGPDQVTVQSAFQMPESEPPAKPNKSASPASRSDDEGHSSLKKRQRPKSSPMHALQQMQKKSHDLQHHI